MSFRITGPGFYRTRDGRKAEVKNETMDPVWEWHGKLDDEYCYWSTIGTIHQRDDSSNLVAPWEEPVAPESGKPAPNDFLTMPPLNIPPTPYHRTEQFRAETARMLFVGLVAQTRDTLEVDAHDAICQADTLIAALDKPAQWVGEAIETKTQLNRPHNQTGEPNHHTTI